jgi:hypothetical protein
VGPVTVGTDGAVGAVGEAVGLPVGEPVGLPVGEPVGLPVGDNVGEIVFSEVVKSIVEFLSHETSVEGDTTSTFAVTS